MFTSERRSFQLETLGGEGGREEEHAQQEVTMGCARRGLGFVGLGLAEARFVILFLNILG